MNNNLFVFIKPNHKLKKSDITNDILHVYENTQGGILTMKDYLQKGKYGAKAIRNHFGSWNKALRELNIPLNRINQNLSKNEIYDIIENLWLEFGCQPSLRDFETKTHHTKKIIISRWGTWLNCLEHFCKYKNNSDVAAFTQTTIKNHKTKREPSDKIRYKVLNRDNFKCQVCGRSPATTLGLTLHVDHVKPWADGGETTMDNLQTLCSDCNLGKGSDTTK